MKVSYSPRVDGWTPTRPARGLEELRDWSDSRISSWSYAGPHRLDYRLLGRVGRLRHPQTTPVASPRCQMVRHGLRNVTGHPIGPKHLVTKKIPLPVHQKRTLLYIDLYFFNRHNIKESISFFDKVAQRRDGDSWSAHGSSPPRESHYLYCRQNASNR